MQDIAIIGAGLSGTIVAILLSRLGFNVDIIERATEEEMINDTSDRTYNLTFYNYATQVLKDIQLWEAIRPVLTPVEGSMNVIERRKLYTKSQVKSWSFRRTVLLKTLLDQTRKKSNIKHFFGNNLVEIRRKDKEVIIQNRSTKEFEVRKYDAVIGTDGVNSRVRMCIQQGQESKHQQEYINWSYKQIDLDKNAVEKLHLENKYTYTWTNKNMILAALPNKNHTFSAVLMLPKDTANSFKNLDTQEKMNSFVCANFPVLAESIPSLIRQAVTHQEGYMVTVRTSPWYYKDFAIIMGDAAHGFLPFSGQGVSAALADAVTFVNLAKKYQGQWEKVFPEFEKERKIQTDLIANLSEKSMERYARSAKVTSELIYEKWEDIMHRFMPNLFQPQLHVLLDHDPTKVSDYMEKQKRQKRWYKIFGGDIWARVICRAYNFIR